MGIQVPEYYFSGLCFSPKQPLALQHRPWHSQAPSQLKESYCMDTASAAETKSFSWQNQGSHCVLTQKPFSMQLCCAEVQLTQLFISLPQHNRETQDSLQCREEVCGTDTQSRLEWYAHLDHSGSFPQTHSQTKGLTQHQFGASIWSWRPLDKKQTKINTEIKQTTEAQLVSIALPLADLTESNTQEPNCLSSEYC